jgi:hypothetical protein
MPTALRSNVQAWQGSGWRAVEAQHKNATISLTHGDQAAQALLEDIIETAKPPMPPDAQGLPFLLSTAFRYKPPPPAGSRFRSRLDPGVFYGAETVRTACAEAGYWRLLFWMDSKGLSERGASLPITVFEFHGATPLAIDLTKPPFVENRTAWTQSKDYTETQALATKARQAGVEMIRYESVRDIPDGRCLAILTPAVFKAVIDPYRHQQQNWSLFIQPPDLTVWQRNLGGDSFEFRFPG